MIPTFCHWFGAGKNPTRRVRAIIITGQHASMSLILTSWIGYHGFIAVKLTSEIIHGWRRGVIPIYCHWLWRDTSIAACRAMAGRILLLLRSARPYSSTFCHLSHNKIPNHERARVDRCPYVHDRTRATARPKKPE
jgi:hypothetical protein